MKIILEIKKIQQKIKHIRPKHIIQNSELSRTTIKNLCNGIKKNYKISTIIKINKYINSFKKENKND